MQCLTLILGFLVFVAVSESRLLRPTVAAPSRRGSWRRKTGLSISVPRIPGRARPMGNNKLSHSLSLNNLNLRPGEAKVIRQTLVVRRLPNSKRMQGRPSRRRGGSGIQSAPRPTSAHGQRGAHPITPEAAVGPQHNSMFLLSRMPSGHRWRQPILNGHNGMASLQLPVIDLTGLTQHSSGIGGAINNPSHSAVQHPSNGHGIGGARMFDQHSSHNTINTGANKGNFANALLAGNPEVIVVQGPVSTPVSSNLGRHGVNNLNQFKMGGNSGHSAFNSNSKSTGVVNSRTHVQTTMEPGEDPPEVP